MKIAYKQHHAGQLDKILAALPKNCDRLARKFTEQFFAKMPASDLDRMDPKYAVGVALSAYEFMRKRENEEPQIRIFTPNRKEHGYDGKYTVIEITNNDMPFLVDSLTNELVRKELLLRETMHPIFKITRDKKGVVQSIASDNDKQSGGINESLIHFEVSLLPEGLGADELEADLRWVLAHIRASVEDWNAIMAKMTAHIAHLESTPGKFPAAAKDEICDFLRWLVGRNFVFLGYAEYDFYDAKGHEAIRVIAKSKLGIMKLTEEKTLQNLEQMLSHPQLMEITKSARRSPVHRSVPMDYIGVKRFDEKGKIIGEIRVLGLFTSSVYYQSTETIPLVRHKIRSVLERSDFDPASHDGKNLKTILEFLPRDELFQMSEEDLFETGMGILALEAKPGTRVFVRRDAFERFISAMVFVPRERFSTGLRYQIQKILEQAYNGTVRAFSTQITEAPLARLHLIIKTTPGDIPQVNIPTIEREIAKRAYLWNDLLQEELMISYGEQKGEALQRLYGNAFPQSYINMHTANAAVHDIEKIEEALISGGLALEMFRARGENEQCIHLKIYNPNEEIAISDIVPMLENAGFRVIEEHPFLVTPQKGARVWIRDFKLQIAGKAVVAFESSRTLVEEVLRHVWGGDMENDRFNTLSLVAGLQWRQIVMLRAYAKYLKQIGFPQSQQSIEQALVNHPDIAGQIAALFTARFNVDEKDRETKQKKIMAAIETRLSSVSNAAEDRILRRYVDVIAATLRTNYYQDNKPVQSFKFASKLVPDLPKPAPYAEIFVYSPRVEGIHLRGGKVARGGLRWSDRHDDFRTEILGLMKAQMVKNSVIVPVGSKGGFVVKRPQSARDAAMEEGIACYRLYLSGLLDITDNIVAGKIVPPAMVVRYDDDDPYLVVAADKGTASFSDIANGVSADYEFWLGDAFASGGSVGYDHKEMAITARGGWVSVERHFAEMGVDIAKQDFTCVGIGDMAGDVFGNGMLLSRHIRLLAAFNHMHIFIDPNPDAKASFAERERLFHLPRSSWKDYDEKLISKGGGVFERSAKTIELSKEAQNALGVHRTKFTPDDLIRAILLAPVDLLWNGGIGTYVKAEDETHEQVGDRANNALRINGGMLRCKIVGEGGNLGFTQKGRIEYARAGGRINTDAIDNSAGVDCSDHEVNIKIAFSPLVAAGKLEVSKRNALLEKMTGDVAALVLKDNILQTQALTIAEQQGAALLESQQRLMHRLEKTGLLDRAIEYLPTDKQIAELKTARKSLTRPEIAVLLAYSKMELYSRILESTLPDEPYFISDLKRYFPKAMQDWFEEAIKKHRLKREIIATVMTNSMVNRAGITYYFDVAEDTGATVRDVAAAYAIARDLFGLRAIWNDIEALTTSIDVPVAVQVDMHVMANRFLEQATIWLLRNLAHPLDLDMISKTLAPAIMEFEKHKQKLHSNTTRRGAEELFENLRASHAPTALAARIASLEQLSSALDIITLAQKIKKPVLEVGEYYFEIGARFNLFWLRLSAEKIVPSSHWEGLALQALVGNLSDEQRRIAAAVIASGDMQAWLARHRAEADIYDQFIVDLKNEGVFDVARLMVALKHIRKFG